MHLQPDNKLTHYVITLPQHIRLSVGMRWWITSTRTIGITSETRILGSCSRRHGLGNLRGFAPKRHAALQATSGGFVEAGIKDQHARHRQRHILSELQTSGQTTFDGS